MAILLFLRVFCYRIYPGKLAFMRVFGFLQGRLFSEGAINKVQFGQALVDGIKEQFDWQTQFAIRMDAGREKRATAQSEYFGTDLSKAKV